MNNSHWSNRGYLLHWAVLMMFCAGMAVLGAQSAPAGQSEIASPDQIRAAAAKGDIAYRLTTREELQLLLGKPERQNRRRDGEMETLTLKFRDAEAVFNRIVEPPGVFTLYELEVEGKPVDIGQGRQIALRTVEDLKSVDAFWGLAGISLAKLDLRQHGARLRQLTFDSLTLWPEPARLPAGFDPVRLLEEGKNPGLGVRELHKAGIDGRGIGIAIVDQPLLRDHEEFKDRIVRYEPIDVAGVPVQMHGPPVASIAVGKTCGVAPKAALYYYAVPAWKWMENTPWAETLDRIVALNRTLTNTPRIRVVSVSLGAFSERPNFERWQQAVKRAQSEGILVVTCDPQFLMIATLRRIEDRPAQEASDYELGRYAYPGAELAIPAGNRTMASYKGPHVYTYDRKGGMSWAVPYLAGLAALACQVDPAGQPEQIVELWKQTASKGPAGAVVNPVGFINALKGRQR